MIIDLAAQSADDAYFLMTQTAIPRPIAWTLSKNENGAYNLAPFSYFNAVASKPPLLMISVGLKPDAANKDTFVNIRARGDFVIHIASGESLDALNQSAATLPYGASEIEQAGLRLEPFPGFALPRLAECRIAFGCALYGLLPIGQSGQTLIFGEIKKLFVADDAVGRDSKGRLKIVAEKIAPLGRLGASEYVLFGEKQRRRRPA